MEKTGDFGSDKLTNNKQASRRVGENFEETAKSKSVLPTDDSLLKMLYLAVMDITKKWTGRRQDWSAIHTQIAVFFADRMPE